MTKKTFHIGAILSVTTELLLTRRVAPNDNGIGEMYQLLGWMTNDNPFTHQLGRFADECKPWLIRWFPELADVNNRIDELNQILLEIPQSDWTSRDTACCEWMDSLKLPSFYDVPQIPKDDHDVKHPWDELVAMRGTDEDIIVASPEHGVIE